jgi:hypothetical protein
MVNNMQSKITFFENDFEVRASDELKIFRPIKPIREFRRFIEYSDWDERMLKYEKYFNLFSVGIIVAAAVFFIPVCISILLR